jgi:AcrR family transcriptional regulator
LGDEKLQQATRRAQNRSVEKRRRIVDAAAKVLARRGYAQATLGEIGKVAGAQAPNIFYYFSSRDELVKEVLLTSLDRMDSAMSEVMEKVSEHGSALATLERTIRAVLLVHTSKGDYYARAYFRTFNQVPPALVKAIDLKRRVIRDRWRGLLHEAQQSGEISPDVDVNLASLMLLGATNWVSVWYAPTGAHSRDEIADAFVAMLMPGLISPGRHARKSGVPPSPRASGESGEA